MQKKLSAQINNINQSLSWIKENRPDDYNTRYLQLVEERRKLRRLQRASHENPAIAAYGISQVGKSYLMNCMLQQEGRPFTIDVEGRTYNFIEEMNPQTKNTEATGVVTRFTSFSRNPELFSPEHPLLMRCLSVKDVILILSDGYFNDIQNYSTFDDNRLNKLAEDIYQRYKDAPTLSDAPIRAEDVLEMKAYVSKHINAAQSITRTAFFDKLALVVENIPYTDYETIFTPMWSDCSYQTLLFKKMLATLVKLNFSEYVYLPASALLHEGMNENTIMSVQCLNQLLLPKPEYTTDVYLRQGNSFTTVSDLSKSEVCAVCAEIVVKIEDEYLEHTGRYALGDIVDQSVLNHVNRDEVKMDLLRTNDLLDFPGARSRKKEQSETLNEDKILINVLLRGKVAYLFNLYNEARMINILLYCHHHMQNDVTDIALLLRNWILNYVGDTMEKRAETLRLTGGISPLFYVATKFNIDLEYESSESANSDNALNGRWQQRFEKVLYHQCFNADGCLDKEKVKVFLNWTRPGENFRNSYLLRDFKYSGPRYSKIYDHETDPTMPTVRTVPEEYFGRLRETFTSNPHVQRFFRDPEMSWDMAATKENDGALYIIENLTKVAHTMDATRQRQFENLLSASVSKVLEVMRDYYVSTDIDVILEENVRKAFDIQRELDFTCNGDNYYFGHLIKALQITEQQVGMKVHEMLQSPEMNKKVNNWDDYEMIRKSCARCGHPLDTCRNENEQWLALMTAYHFTTQEDAADYLKRKNVDKHILFRKTPERRVNSYIIADAVFEQWSNGVLSVDFANKVAGDNGFDPITMNYLVENLVKTAKNINLPDIMADAIAEYVNVVDLQKVNEYLLSDILSSLINEFVLDLGYSRLTKEERDEAHRISREKEMPDFKQIYAERRPSTNEELTELFNQMTENPKVLSPSFENNYELWLEYLFLSFVSHLKVPVGFNIAENEKLQKILEKINQNN